MLLLRTQKLNQKLNFTVLTYPGFLGRELHIFFHFLQTGYSKEVGSVMFYPSVAEFRRFDQIVFHQIT